MKWLILIGVLLVPMTGAGQSEGPPSRAARVARQLQALETTPEQTRESLRHQLLGRARASCGANVSLPPLACLEAEADKTCSPRADQTRCLLIADLVWVNYLARDEWLGPNRRRSIIERGGDVRAALEAATQRAYARLAADFALGGKGQLPAAIDGYCLEGRAKVRVLPWNRCVAALVWYIGTNAGRQEQ